MLIFWSLVRNSVVLAVYLLFSVACFFTVHEHSAPAHSNVAPAHSNVAPPVHSNTAVNNALKDLQDINVSDIPAIGNIQIPESNVVPDIQSVAIKSAANIPDITAATSISTR